MNQGHSLLERYLEGLDSKYGYGFRLVIALTMAYGMYGTVEPRRGAFVACVVGGFYALMLLLPIKLLSRLAHAHPFVDASFGLPIGWAGLLVFTNLSAGIALIAALPFAIMIFGLTQRRMRAGSRA